MSDFTLSLSITADGKLAVREIQNTTAAQKSNEDQAKRSNQTTRQSTTELERYMASLRKEADTLGMTKSQIRLYEAARLGATQADLRAIAVTSQLIDAQQRQAGSMGGLTRQVAQYASAATALMLAKHLAEASDNAVLLNARIGMVTRGLYQAARAQDELFQLAQQLQLPFIELANQFPRIARAIQGYGGSTRDAINITRIFAQTVRAGGASTAEAAASAMQFAQALQSGRLAGDELRSILENNGLLADHLARGLGVSVGELRKLGEEGKLTSEKVVEALMKQQSAIEAQAGSIPKTVKGSFTALTNEIDKATSSAESTSLSVFMLIGTVDLLTAAVKRLREAGTIELPLFNTLKDLARVVHAVGNADWSQGNVFDAVSRGKPNYASPSWNAAEDARFARQAGAIDQQEARQATAARTIRDLIKETDTAAGVNARYTQKVEELTAAWVKAAAAGSLTEDEIKALTAAIQAETAKRQEAIDKLGKKGRASLESETELVRRRADLQIAGGEAYLKIQRDNLARALDIEEYYHQIGLTSERDYIDARANLQAEGARRVISQLQGELAAEEAVLSALRSKKGVGPTEATKHQADIEQQEKKILAVRTELDIATKSLGDVERRRGQDTVRAERAIANAVLATQRAQEDYQRGLEEELEEVERSISLAGESEAVQARANAQMAALNKHLQREAELRRQLYDLRKNKPSATEEIDALEAALAELQTKGIQTIIQLGDAVERHVNLKQVVQEWQSWAQTVGQLTADVAMDWENRHDYMRRISEQFWRQMIAMYAQKLVLQIGAQIVGGQGGNILAGQAASLGQGTLTGWLGNAIGGWATNAIGGTALGQFWGGMTGNIAGPALQGSALSYGQQAGALMGSLWWIAPIVAGMIANDKFFKQGWRHDNQDYSNPALRGATFFSDSHDRTMRSLGFSDRIASLVSGSSLTARLLGHGPVRADAYGLMGSISGSGFTGQAWQDFSRQGGTFRSDQRWQDRAPFNSEQQRWLASMMGGVNQWTSALASRLGVDRGAALAGYNRDFNIQLSNNGEPLSEEELAKVFGDLLAEVLRDQVAAILRSGGNTALAEYVQNLKGSGEEIAATVQAIVGLVDSVKSLDLVMAEMDGDITAGLKEQLRVLKANVADAKAAMTAALESGDPVKILEAERELTAAVMERYRSELQMIQQLRDAIDQAREEAYQFSVSIAGRINAVGGSRDIGSIALNRAGVLRSGIGGNANMPGQVRDINRYVGAIDTWYNARRSEIERQMAAEQAALQAIASAQQAAAQARIAQLQGELALAQQYQAVVDRTREMLDGLRFSSANPMALSGRTAMAREDVQALMDRYRTSTGAGRVDIANQILRAIGTYQSLGQQLYQRPSAEWQAIYNEIVRDLTEVQDDAKSFAERSVEIERQILEVQQQSGAYQAAIAGATAAANAQLDALNAEALGYYTWAEQEAQRVYTEAERQHREQLNAITGGTDVELYVAQIQREAREELRSIRELLAAFLAAVGGTGTGTTGAGATTTTTGGGSTGNGPTGTVQSKAQLVIDGRVLGELIIPIVDGRVLGPLSTQLKRRGVTA